MKIEDIPTGNTPVTEQTVPPGAVKKDERILEVQNKLQELSDRLGEIITTMHNSAELIRSWIETDNKGGN
jgi:hypothetical protein